jgi:hypothetical protein
MLNLLTYTLRNKDAKGVLRKILRKRLRVEEERRSYNFYNSSQVTNYILSLQDSWLIEKTLRRSQNFNAFLFGGLDVGIL